jgi:hypothetical protein
VSNVRRFLAKTIFAKNSLIVKIINIITQTFSLPLPIFYALNYPKARDSCIIDQLLAQREKVVMANKSKKDAVISNRADLNLHVEAFLKAGGQVQQIPSGVSGQTSTSGPRQIVLSHKNSS